MSRVTVEELHQYLTDLIAEGKGDYEVRVAYQPSYPMEVPVTGYADPSQVFEDEMQEEFIGASENGEIAGEAAAVFQAELGEAIRNAPKAIYLATPEQNNYLQVPRRVFESASDNRFNYGF